MNQVNTSQDLANMPGKSASRLYSRHIAVLLGGALSGFVISYWICGLSFDFSHEIELARSLGIVSPTILCGYPPSLNVMNYIFVLVVPVLSSISLWLIWSHGKKNNIYGTLLIPHESFPYVCAQNRKALILFPVIAAGLLLTFNINWFFRPSFNDSVGSWLFLGEEGEMVAWAYRVISGEVFGKDFFCLYGPMQIYPLALFLKLFGMNVLAARIFTHLLMLISMGVVVFFLYSTIRNKLIFIVSCLVCFFLLNMLSVVPSPNTTMLRNILGILPLLLLYLHRRTPANTTLIFTGLVIGQSLLFSQEFGLCSIIAIGFLFLLEMVFEKEYRRSAREAGIIAGSFLISVSPCLLYLAYNNAFGAFLDSLYGYPRLVALGYGGLQFPPFRMFLKNPLNGGMYLPYWTIFTYVFVSIYVATRFFIGKADTDAKLKLMLTVFGILAFRVALGRYAELNVLKAITPALLLCFLFMDDAVSMIRSKGALQYRLGNVFLFIVMVIPLAFLFIYAPYVKYQSFMVMKDFLNPSGKFIIKQSGMEIPEIKRAGIFVHKSTGGAIQKINKFLSEHTKPEDCVYFFPNAPMYYFLFDRKNPTRFALSYMAISTQQRLEAVRDLEKNKPEYVVYNLNTWRVDDIPESIQVPEIVSYIHRKYKIMHKTKDLLFMVRNN